ncbi:MAG: hypothetical protein U5J83_00740 [Bryobacterales bacterium]|nr:hypothetical protein [Bryobacterales bacterium]
MARRSLTGMPVESEVIDRTCAPHEAGTAWVAATMYKSDDFRPYLYSTKVSGKTWTKVVNRPDDAFTR